jgi:rSAM/selenodomain-associated transferase 2
VIGQIEAARRDLTVSFVIPSWHDAKNLAVLVPRLAELFPAPEIIVVAVSGDADSERIAAAHGARFAHFATPSRGEQMNFGASLATGDVLVFQHADTEFSELHRSALESALQNRAVVGGAFYRKFDERHPRLMWLEKVARWLTRHGGTLFGDQTVFVRRDIFAKLGGFARIPLMEDVEFSPRLRRAGQIALLDPPVRSSARHHDRKGAWRRTIQNGLMLFLYKIGVRPQSLHRWYYGHQTAPDAP